MAQPYHSLEAELHDAFWEAEDGGSEVRLMARFLRKHPGPALEIGCGSGRLMLPLLASGFDVEGLELSQDMLTLGRQRAERMGQKPIMHHGDMCQWHGRKRYAALLAPAFTLQLAPDPEAALRHWHDLLENHGGLYLTLFIPYAELLGELPENQWYLDRETTLPDGRLATVETRHHIDQSQNVLHREHRYRLEGTTPTTHTSTQTIRWMEPDALPDLLPRCGFHLMECFADFDPSLSIGQNEMGDGIITCHALKIDRQTDH